LLTAHSIKDRIRVPQYYKNSIIFLGLIFAPEYVSVENIFLIFLGFGSLCLVSSANYIRNDIMDINADKKHPTKKNRPLASGLVTLREAHILFAIFVLAGFALSFILDIAFGILVVLFFLITEAYSRWLKKIVLVDVFAIGLNFIIRAILGIILINSQISPWIIIGVFFVALLLAFMKRKSEIETLDDQGKQHRKTLQEYNSSFLNSMVIMAALSVIITYAFYSLVGPQNDWRLVLTVPIVTFIIFRQVYLSSINDPLVQKNVNMIKDVQTNIVISIYLAVTIYLIYFAPSDYFN